MKSVLDHLNIFNHYIQGGSSETLKNELDYYKYNLNELKTNFREVIITDDDEVVLQVQIILANLNIPKSHWPSYIKRKNIYQFLEKLNRRGFIQIAYILQLIDEKTQMSKGKLIAAGSGVLTILLSSLFIPQFVILRLALQTFVLSIFSLPVLGLISKIFSTAYHLYNNHVDKKRALIKRLQDNGFVLGSFVVNLIAHILWIIAASPMTPLIAGLFVLASVLNVAKEIISLGHYAIKYVCREALPTTTDFNLYRNHIRNEYSYFTQRNTAFINLLAAILLVGVMASWSFLPSGIIVTIGTFAAIATIALVKKIILTKSERIIRERLQLQLQHINEVEEKLTVKAPLIEAPSVSVDKGAERVKQLVVSEQKVSYATPTPTPTPTPTYLLVKKLKFLFWQQPENIEIPLQNVTSAPLNL